MSRLPFAIRPKTDIVAVGSDETGILYLERLYGRTAGERVEIDDIDAIRTKGQLFLLRFATRIAAEHGLSPEESLTAILSRDVTTFTFLMDYTDDLERLLSLQSDTNNYKEHVATILIKNRLAYPVVVSRDAAVNAEVLSVEPLGKELSVKTNIKFKAKTIVQLHSQAEYNEDELNIFPLEASLSKGDIGFVVDENNKELIGLADWTLVDTKGLPESLVDALFEFYENETRGWEVEEKTEKKERSRKASKSSKSTLPQNQSIGQTSTGESSPTE